MTDAPVGFHCPDCVAEARRTTRQARTPLGGVRPGSYGLVSKILIAINAAVWALILATGGNNSEWVYRLALIPRGVCLATDHPGNLYPGLNSSTLCSKAPDGAWVGVAAGDWWQPLTSMFTAATSVRLSGADCTAPLAVL